MLLDSVNRLPSELRYDTGSRDDFLASMLRLVGLSDLDVQVSFAWPMFLIFFLLLKKLLTKAVNFS